MSGAQDTFFRWFHHGRQEGIDWRRWLTSGPAVTCGLIFLHLSASAAWPAVRGVSCILLFAVVYATYRGGLASGAVSGLISFAYFVYAFSEKRIFEYDRLDLERLASLFLVIPGTIGLVHSLKMRLVQSELAKTLLAEREERRMAEAAQEQRYRILLQDHARELENRVVVRTQELAESVRSLKEVSSTIAHDLRNPLRYIMGHTELLTAQAAGRLDAADERLLERIRFNAARMHQLINDLLRYTSLHHLPVALSAVDLRPIVAAVLDRFNTALQGSDGIVRANAVLPTVWGDPQIIEDVIANLVDNALKFKRRDVAPVVTIAVVERPEGPRILVRDNGVGIPPQGRSRMFQPFERLHPDHDQAGIGIGLAIVAKGMQLMGGEAGVDSEPEKGSTFWLQFPHPPAE